MTAATEIVNSQDSNPIQLMTCSSEVPCLDHPHKMCCQVCGGGCHALLCQHDILASYLQDPTLLDKPHCEVLLIGASRDVEGE